MDDLKNDISTKTISEAFLSFVSNRDFPCIAAKAALSENQIKTFVADHLACPRGDKDILKFLYDFVDSYRASGEMYHSAVIIFTGPQDCPEHTFGEMLWRRLQSISDLDAAQFGWDKRVESATDSADFSFSIKEEAFYVIGLHGNSSRKSRQFKYPALVFNPHDQFQKLRSLKKYDPMKNAVRKRDTKLSGSVNPMLADFGESSEVFQYSGIQYDSTWKCPFVAKHETTKHNSTP